MLGNALSGALRVLDSPALEYRFVAAYFYRTLQKGIPGIAPNKKPIT